MSAPARTLVPRVPLHLRRARFVDGPELGRLIERAIERGCRDTYSAAQRRAVYVSYAQRLFLELVEPFDTFVAEHEGTLLGVAQLDPKAARLRGLFVDDRAQGHGVGRALLHATFVLARAHGLHEVVGAMSLNAVNFYTSAGFEPAAGGRTLLLDGVVVPVLPMSKRL